MRCIIAGTRTASREETRAAIDACPFKYEIETVLCGGAAGADTFGEEWAYESIYRNVQVEYFPAQWEKFGKSAGARRNMQMVQAAGTEGGLIAVWDGKSPGTRNMIYLATELGLRTFIYRTDRRSP